MNWTELVTVVAAGLGAVLGIMNTWHAMGSRKLRLNVRAAHALLPPHGGDAVVIEVVNFSLFPVTVEELGFQLLDGRKLIDPSMRCTDGGPWPRRLESRQSVSLLLDPQGIFPMLGQVSAPYARTACGSTIRGNRRLFRKFSGQSTRRA